MRLALISDIHANLEALQATLRRIETDHIDEIVCLGDIVGYNANPAECIDAVRGCAALCVAGNHDRAVCGQISMEEFSVTAARAVVWTRSRLAAEALDFLSGLPLTRSIGNDLVAVHGALHPSTGQELVRLNSEERRQASFEALLSHPSGARVCAFGHTHHLQIHELRNGRAYTYDADEVSLREDAVYLVNPGSVGQPRTAERRATYLVLDTARQAVSVRRIDYDAKTAFSKARAARLVPRSHRLPSSIRSGLKRGARAIGLRSYSDETASNIKPVTDIALLNRRSWRNFLTVRDYQQVVDLQVSEKVVLDRLQSEIAGKRILDIGVGAGRTTGHLLGISQDYVGLDYSARMIRKCQTKYPFATFVSGDARDLSRFGAGSFDFVMFSYNGIDYMGHTDRLTTFSQIRRILAPGGIFVFLVSQRELLDFQRLGHRSSSGRGESSPQSSGFAEKDSFVPGGHHKQVPKRQARGRGPRLRNQE